ncbi:MAG: ABC transporter permease [Acidimicrobiales bacterium]
MTRFEVVRLVAGREIRERVRSKAFRISAGLSLAFILAVAILPGVLGDDGPTIYDVGVYGAGAEALAERLADVAALDDGVEVDVRRLAGGDEGRRLVEAGDLDAALGDGEVTVQEDLRGRLGVIVAEANRRVVTAAALAAAGIGGEAATPILAPAPLTVRALDPESEENNTKKGLVFFGTILLYGQLLAFGYWVSSGVVEEKASRVVEVLLAKVPPNQLLAGKVLGIGVVGLAQLVGFVLVGLLAAVVTGSFDLPPETPAVAAQVIGWFVLGFALYSGLFAVAGAIASRAEELQSTTTPLTFLTMGSFFAAVTAGGDPGGPVAQVATFVPFSAPMVLPIRISAGEIELWAVLVSVAIVVVSILGAMRLAARVYAGGAMHLRGQLKLRQALRARETSGLGA